MACAKVIGFCWRAFSCCSLRSHRPRNLDPGRVRSELHRALSVWSKHSNLTFQEINSDRADILVYFERFAAGKNKYMVSRRLTLAFNRFSFPDPAEVTTEMDTLSTESDRFWLTPSSPAEEEAVTRISTRTRTGFWTRTRTWRMSRVPVSSRSPRTSSDTL